MTIRELVLKTISQSLDVLEQVHGLKYLPYNLIWGQNLQGYKKSSVQRSLNRAIQQGLVKKSIKKGKVYLALTELGKRFLEESSRKNNKLSLDLTVSENKWDGIYRFIFFDIPEKDRLIRDTLRRELKSIGGVGWQKSVWVTKEDVTRELNNFIQENGLSDYLSIVEVKEIYNPKLTSLLDSNGKLP